MFKSIHFYFYFIVFLILSISLYINYVILSYPSIDVSIGTFGSILGSIVSLFGITIVYLSSRKQFKQQEKYNTDNLTQMKKEYEEVKSINDINIKLLRDKQSQQQKQIQLSQVERQISNIVNFILRNYIEKKEFYPKFENFIINKKGWNKNEYTIRENHNILFFTNEKTCEEITVEKSSIMTLLYSYSINKILSLDELKEYIEKSTFKSEVKTFVYQLNYLIIMTEKSLDLGLDRLSAKYNLALFSMFADIAYDLGYVEEIFYFKLKVLTDDFDYLKKIFLSELKIEYKINESNIKDIVSYKNELNQYTFEVYLHGFDFNLIRDEKAIWNKNKKNENEICYNN